AEPLTARLLWLGLKSRVGTREMRRKGYLERMVPPDPDDKVMDALADELPGLFGHDLADRPPIVDAQLRAMRESNLAPMLGGLERVTTLVMCAEHDPIAPPSAAREIAAGVPQTKLVQFANASHGLPITHASDVNGLLSEHLN